VVTSSPESSLELDFPIGQRMLSIDDVLGLARGELRATLDDDPAHQEKLARSRRIVTRSQLEGRSVYGVTTGVGASAGTAVPEGLRGEMVESLMRFHGVGTGRILDETESAATVVIRLASLARGHSGVRPELLEGLCLLLNERLLPCIPEEGSVGASGDLTPLSYLVAALVGEREVTLRGTPMTAAESWAAIGREPLALAPKESLALMNGTSVMTAIACIVHERARRLARLAAAITAIVVDVTRGNREHFDARIFEFKPHPGSMRCAGWIRDDLEIEKGRDAMPPARLQDRYSVRCSPHVIGVLVDALESSGQILETEINGVDDNPLIDPEGGDVLHGGNFYGGHVCFAMDGLKSAVASVADLLDRQLALLCVPETSDGLPADLEASGSAAHHGFKAMQVSASALTAEALKLTVPAAAFSRSTESHNQDKVSMGTIAARDCRRIVELSETVAVIVLLAACQALDLRAGGSELRAPLALRDAVRKVAAMVVEDRRQDRDIERVLAMLREGALPLGSF